MSIMFNEICIYIYIYMHVYICICICVYICVCIYIYVCWGERPPMCCHWVDDGFYLFGSGRDANSFLIQLGSVHPSLKFAVVGGVRPSARLFGRICTMGLLQLFSLLCAVVGGAFSGLCVRWDLFCAQQRGVSLVGTLVCRALMVSSACFLGSRVEFVRSALSRGRCKLSVLDGVVHDVLGGFDGAGRCTIDECPV